MNSKFVGLLLFFSLLCFASGTYHGAYYNAPSGDWEGTYNYCYDLGFEQKASLMDAAEPWLYPQCTTGTGSGAFDEGWLDGGYGKRALGDAFTRSCVNSAETIEHCTVEAMECFGSGDPDAIKLCECYSEMITCFREGGCSSGTLVSSCLGIGQCSEGWCIESKASTIYCGISLLLFVIFLFL